jgi:hypothetical protein
MKDYKFLSFKSFPHGVISIVLCVIMLYIAAISLRMLRNGVSVLTGGMSSGCGSSSSARVAGSEVATNSWLPTMFSANRSASVVVRRPISFFTNS